LVNAVVLLQGRVSHRLHHFRLRSLDPSLGRFSEMERKRSSSVCALLHSHFEIESKLLSLSRAMRRRYGIPDTDHRPFNVAHAAVLRARQEREAQERSKHISSPLHNAMPEAQSVRERYPHAGVLIFTIHVLSDLMSPSSR
jgi:hypothetical protein